MLTMLATPSGNGTRPHSTCRQFFRFFMIFEHLAGISPRGRASLLEAQIPTAPRFWLVHDQTLQRLGLGLVANLRASYGFLWLPFKRWHYVGTRISGCVVVYFNFITAWVL